MTKCQNCRTNCVTILNLGNQVICNRFFKSKTDLSKEKKYPLRIVFCPKCALVQQAVVLPTNVIFDKNFNYLSGASSDAVRHFANLAKMLIKQFNLNQNDFVVAIGSNDGTELEPFKERGIRILGIEPAPKPAKIANDNGISTLVGELENSTAEILRETGGKIKLVLAFNVMAHTSTIHSFLESVSLLLRENPNATFINQSQYLPDIIEKVSYDTMYHEHSRFYSLTSMQNLFERHGLHIYDSERIGYYGGSIIAYASYITKPQTQRHKAILRSEARYTKLESYRQFSKKVEKRKTELLKLLNQIKAKGQTVVGGGAPMKSTVLLNYCRIGPDFLNALTESNKLKVGTYSPSGIKVEDEHTYYKKHKPDYVLILSWNLAPTMIKDLRACGFHGKFIIPLPTLKIV